MQPNRKQPINFIPSATTSVNQIVDDLLEFNGPRLSRHNISIETDLEPTSALIDASVIQSAIQALLDNAIESMPDGGVLSATLINGKHQWEFEVADTSGIAYSSIESCTPTDETTRLPVVIPFPETDQLRDAYRSASKLGGQIQTWDCPQGGTAHVLVIPRRHQDRPEFETA